MSAELVPILQASFERGILIDESEGNVLYANETAQSLFGLDESSPANLKIDGVISFFISDKLAPWEEIHSKTAPSQNLAVMCHKTDGSSFPGTARLATVGSYVIAYIRPTEKRTSTSIVTREKRLLEGVLNSALDPLFQINEKGIIQMANKAATSQFGWTRDEFVGKNISMVVGPEHAPQHDKYIERYLKTGISRVMGSKRELIARRKDGSEFVIQLSLVEVDIEEGEERAFCGFIIDLTNEKAYQDNIRLQSSWEYY